MARPDVLHLGEVRDGQELERVVRVVRVVRNRVVRVGSRHVLFRKSFRTSFRARTRRRRVRVLRRRIRPFVRSVRRRRVPYLRLRVSGADLRILRLIRTSFRVREGRARGRREHRGVQLGVGDGDEVREQAQRLEHRVESASARGVAQVPDHEAVQNRGRGVSTYQKQDGGDVVHALVVPALAGVRGEHAANHPAQPRAAFGARRGWDPMTPTHVELDLVTLARVQRGGAALEQSRARVRAGHVQRQELGPGARARRGVAEAPRGGDSRELGGGRHVQRQQTRHFIVGRGLGALAGGVGRRARHRARRKGARPRATRERARARGTRACARVCGAAPSSHDVPNHPRGESASVMRADTDTRKSRWCIKVSQTRLDRRRRGKRRRRRRRRREVLTSKRAFERQRRVCDRSQHSQNNDDS